METPLTTIIIIIIINTIYITITEISLPVRCVDRQLSYEHMTEVKDLHTTRQETNKTGHQMRDEASVKMHSKFPVYSFFFWVGKLNSIYISRKP